jgi:hypothetical protein
MHEDQSVNPSLRDKTSCHHCFSERRRRTEYAVVIGKYLLDGVSLFRPQFAVERNIDFPPCGSFVMNFHIDVM